MERVLKAIYEQVRNGKDYRSYVDLKDFCREVMKTDIPLAIKYLSLLSDRIEQVIPTLPLEEMSSFFELHHDVVLLGAPHSFHLYLLAVEWRRDPSRKFYQPRRRVLRVLVDDLQDLADHKLDFLGISLPPRVGKSALCIFFMTWMMGRNPDVANVMSGHSDKLPDGFSRELLSIIKDTTQYDWPLIFPNVPIADTSAKNETIDLNHTKRFPTMTCRSIGGTLTGAVEIGSGGVLYCDDLVEDLEESLNPDRLEAKYNAYLNQLKDRKKLGALELMVGTRWNVFDPLGRIQDQYDGNERYRFRVIPALNEDDESNFNYEYGVGFDTAYYRDMRESIDDATWNAKYQGAPYIREGLLFPEDELLTYNGVLPDGDPEKVVVCDVAWGGGDSLSMPIVYKFGEDVYIHDVVFNKGDKSVTYPVVIGRIKLHLPHKARFEANNGGHEYADNVDKELRKDGIHLHVFSKKAPSTQSKLARIIQFAPDIKRFYFLGTKYRSKEYREFMREVTTFVQTGKNPHDDAADSLAMVADELYHGTASVSVVKRPF